MIERTSKMTLRPTPGGLALLAGYYSAIVAIVALGMSALVMGVSRTIEALPWTVAVAAILAAILIATAGLRSRLEVDATGYSVVGLLGTKVRRWVEVGSIDLRGPLRSQVWIMPTRAAGGEPTITFGRTYGLSSSALRDLLERARATDTAGPFDPTAG